MSTINVGQAFKLKNDILRTLLHKGKPNELLTLVFFKSNALTGGRIQSASITSGWNHIRQAKPTTGPKTEVIKVSASTTITQEIINKSVGCDIVYEDGTFERFEFSVKTSLNPITQEWTLDVQPSLADVTPLDT